MDINDILSFKPPTTVKRPLEDNAGQTSKKSVREDTDTVGRQVPNTSTQPSSVRSADTQRMVSVEEQKSNVTKNLCDWLEKKKLKNLEMRSKFPDEPLRFMQSEVELHDVIRHVHHVVSCGAVLPDNVLSGLVDLLTHHNNHIALDVIAVLKLMIDDSINSSTQDCKEFIETLDELQLSGLLTCTLERFDENVSVELQALHHVLGILQLMAEYSDEYNDVTYHNKQLMTWLLRRVRHRSEVSTTHLYVSELLSTLTHGSRGCQVLTGELDGVDVLLQQLAVFKKTDPHTDRQTEYMNNLFNCLCACLQYVPNRHVFVVSEGLQLMILMLRSPRQCRFGAVKVLNHSMSGHESRDVCHQFIDCLGLSALFPMFMKSPRRACTKFYTVDEFEEHVISIICFLLKNCTGVQRQRVVNKFLEHNLEKVDRLMEMYFKYMDKLNQYDEHLGNTGLPMNDDERYVARLTGGLFVVQLLVHIIVSVSWSENSVKTRIVQTVNLHGASCAAIVRVMREYAVNLGDAAGEEEQERERQSVLEMIEKF